MLLIRHAPGPSPALLPFSGNDQCLSYSDGSKTEHSNQFIGAEYRRTVSSLVLLDTLFFIQARMPLDMDMWTYCWLMFMWASTSFPQNLLFHSAFKPLWPKPIALHAAVVPKCRTWHLVLLNFIPLASAHQSSLSRSLSRAFFLSSCRLTHPPQLAVICKFSEVALNSIIQIINTDIKQDGSQYGPIRNTTSGWLPAGFNSIYQHFLSLAIQPVFLPSN